MFVFSLLGGQRTGFRTRRRGEGKGVGGEGKKDVKGDTGEKGKGNVVHRGGRKGGRGAGKVKRAGNGR